VAFTQRDYMQRIANMTNSRTSKDSDAIKTTIKTFLTLSKAYIRDFTNYSNKMLINNGYKESAIIQYYYSTVEYDRRTRDLLGWGIISDDITFWNYSININGYTASASIVETYHYISNDGFGDSYRTKEYFFELIRADGIWQIISIKTNDPWEMDDTFIYIPIDVDAVIINIIDEENAAKNINIAEVYARDISYSKGLLGSQNNPPNNISSTLYAWTYSSAAAVSYAAANYNKTAATTQFGYNSGANCQNFASQCVFYGYGGTSSTNKTARPAISQTLVGQSSPLVWCQGQDSTYYSSNEYWKNYSWDNVRGFFNLVSQSSVYTEGPTGWITTGLDFVDVGNVIAWAPSGSTTIVNLTHAMFVTQVTGTSGLRTKSNISIAAHTSNTNSAYMALTSYDPNYSASQYMRAQIVNGYYGVVQP